ncbi:beta strand repeat-containing protein [Undibacterium fentianense]|uniref:Uncharacterized protein n=1 Tax=Undibacterium fentianense TaxID=2828728 RepID=A0A941E3F9_9BURK|nr:hypothetical protein [Undibacterium fentianense]MBR7801640.1 hypothetical protein [Undibacterium fentianense]
MTKLIRAFFAMTVLLMLSACGGGGGSAGNTSGVALFTSAADKIIIAPGEIQTYNVGGGVPNYTATSSSGAASVSVSGKTLTITGGGGGTATITVVDASGARVTIEATVGSGVDLFTSAPEKLNLGIGQVSTTFTIGGGSRIYTVASGNRQVVAVTQNGSQFYLTGVAVGVSTVTINDTLGGSKKVEVTVGSGAELYTTAPSTVVVSVGGTSSTYQIGGGSEIYSLTSSDRSVATVLTVSPKEFAIVGQAGGKAVVTVTDSLGKSVKLDIVVGSLVDLFTTAPSLVTVGVGATSAVYTIGGGSQIYAVSSSDKRIATVGQTTSKEFIITGQTGGKAVVTVKDSLGKEIKIDVVVGTVDALFSTAASEVTVEVGGANAYKVGGGTTVYTVGSSNIAVAKATLTGNDLVITGVSTGKATVIVRDSTTGILSINVTVGTGTPTPLFTTASSDVVIAPSTSPTFTIGGGRAPYLVSSSNTSVLTATVSGSTLTLSGVAVGSAKVTVTDSSGTPLTINATVGSGTVVPLFTTAPSSITLASGSSASYSIGGGTAPYSVASSNSGVASVSSTAGGFTVNGVAAGAAEIVIRDSLGAPVNIAVTVSSVANTAVNILPGDSTGAVGDTLVFKISGGSPNYTITNNNPSIATVSPTSISTTGGTFTAKLLNVGATLVTIVDSQGQTKSITITATAASSLLRISPNTLLVAEESTNTIDLSIYGGTPPYRAFTSDLNLSSVSIVSTSTLRIGLGSTGNRCFISVDESGTYKPLGIGTITLTVLDSLGASATALFNLKDNGMGDPITGVGGCTPIP